MFSDFSDLDKGTVRNLVFLEFLDEAKAFLKKRLKEIKCNPEKFKIITFNPLIKAYLLKYNVKSIDSFHFCPIKSCHRLLLKLEEYTKQVREKCRLSDPVGITISYTENLLFSLRIVLTNWLYRVETISNAIDYYEPQVVFTVGPDRINVAVGILVEPTERPITNIVNQICSKKNIKVVNTIMRVGSKRLKRALSNCIKNWLTNLASVLSRYRMNAKHKLIISTSCTHNIAALLDDLRKELSQEYDIAILDLPVTQTIRCILDGLRVRQTESYMHFPFNINRRRRFSKDFINDKDKFQENLYNLIEQWNYRGVNSDWLKIKYRKGLAPAVIDKTYYQSVNIDRYLNRFRPVLVLSPHARAMGSVWGEICELKKVDSLLVPHGSFVPVEDEYSKKEWRENALGQVNAPYKYLALQTPLIEKFILDIPVKSKLIITGPLIFARNCKRGRQSDILRSQYVTGNEKIILHASTPKDRRGQRFLNYETVDEYVDGICALIKAIEKIKGIFLIIRYRPKGELGVEDLKASLPKSNSYSIVSGGNFIDSLSISDLLVSYSSSTIEEALNNNVPVLIFNKYNRYQHIRGTKIFPSATNIMPSAVYNVDSEADLCFAIEWILNNHLPRKNLLNNIFDEYKYKPEQITKLPDFIRELTKNESFVRIP